eukprot:TRINITY_DN4803_c0_g1_i3.p1 TRINITY_DN4803_c0_g1~~TRINITY_DN4803_c0_g1_i3.p1  ORF type:complete len:112 (+),score=20.66 TRINITY_DN4803_c0_g1_i3:42-377(+)
MQIFLRLYFFLHHCLYLLNLQFTRVSFLISLDVLSKLDWRLKRIQKNVYGDDIEAADTYRKIYARDSTHRSESVSLPFSPLKKTSLEQRMTRIEETQNQILELLQKQAGGP